MSIRIKRKFDWVCFSRSVFSLSCSAFSRKETLGKYERQAEWGTSSLHPTELGQLNYKCQTINNRKLSILRLGGTFSLSLTSFWHSPSLPAPLSRRRSYFIFVLPIVLLLTNEWAKRTQRGREGTGERVMWPLHYTSKSCSSFLLQFQAQEMQLRVGCPAQIVKRCAA